MDQSEWLSSKNPQTTNDVEGVERREPSYAVGGNVGIVQRDRLGLLECIRVESQRPLSACEQGQWVKLRQTLSAQAQGSVTRKQAKC